MNYNLSISTFIDYLLIFALLACSGIPFFTGDRYIILLFLISLSVFIYRNKKIDLFIIGFLSLYILLLIVQATYSKYFYITRIIGPCLRILSAYFVVKSIGSKFTEIFVKWMTFFAIVSIPFYVGLLISTSKTLSLFNPLCEIIQKHSYMEFHAPQMIIYTFNFGVETHTIRNSGAFWEPGGFGLYLNLAFILNTVCSKTLINRTNIILLIALATTLSTASYILCAFFILSYLLIQYQTKYIVFILPVLILLFGYLYTSVEFLNEKISRQLLQIQYSSVDYQSRTRFVSALADWEVFKKNPVFGAGVFQLSEEQRRTYSNRQMYYRNNGTFNILAIYGLTGFLFYFINALLSFQIFCKENNTHYLLPFILLIAFLLMNSSQMVYHLPFLWALTFVFRFSK